MDPEAHPYEPLSTATPPPGRRAPRRVPRAAVAVGMTAFLGLAGAGVAFAVGGGGGASPASLSASSSTTSTTQPGAHPNLGPHGRRGAGFGGLGFGGAGLGRHVVHGQFTIGNGSSYKTVTVQVGQVTAVSSSSITVKSSDGFTQTYTVDPTTVVDSQSGGISAVTTTDSVKVEGLVQGNKQTATDIVDTTKVGASRKGFGLGGPREGGGPASHQLPPGGPAGATTAA